MLISFSSFGLPVSKLGFVVPPRDVNLVWIPPVVAPDFPIPVLGTRGLSVNACSIFISLLRAGSENLSTGPCTAV